MPVSKCAAAYPANVNAVGKKLKRLEFPEPVRIGMHLKDLSFDNNR
jgi:hypothetical protein